MKRLTHIRATSYLEDFSASMEGRGTLSNKSQCINPMEIPCQCPAEKRRFSKTASMCEGIERVCIQCQDTLPLYHAASSRVDCKCCGAEVSRATRVVYNGKDAVRKHRRDTRVPELCAHVPSCEPVEIHGLSCGAPIQRGLLRPKTAIRKQECRT